MKKIYSTLLLALISLTAFSQEQNDTTYVMLNFTDNPWNYQVTEVTSGWRPDYKDLESPGSILEPTDFSWTFAEESAVKITLIPNDWTETYQSPVFGCVEPGSEAISLGVTTEKMNVLYTVSGTTMRFEAPAGYKFGKMVFYCFHSSNFLVGDEYEEEFEYQYNGETFKQKLKVWKPTSPKKNQYDYNCWDGDETNILFNYPYFSAHFVKIDIRLVPDGSSGINEVVGKTEEVNDELFNLSGQRVTNSKNKGVYIVNGKKILVK